MSRTENIHYTCKYIDRLIKYIRDENTGIPSVAQDDIISNLEDLREDNSRLRSLADESDNDLEKTIKDLEEEIDSLNGTIEDLRSDVKYLEEEIGNLKDEIKRLNNEL